MCSSQYAVSKVGGYTVITTVTNNASPSPSFRTLQSAIIIDDAHCEFFYQERKGNGCSSSNQSSSCAAHPKSSLPRWSLLGQDATCSPGHAKLGIGQSKNWKPLWTTLPETRVSSRELLGRCKCKKAALNCTALCQCGGECDI